jgi:hypothetical protein
LQIGDRIKLLHQNTEGTLKQLYPNGMALVELEGEFEVEVLQRDVVRAAPPPPTAHAPAPRAANPLAEKLAPGVYISIRFRPDGTWHYELANHTPAALLFGLWTQAEGKRTGALTGKVEPKTTLFLFKANGSDWAQKAHLVFHLVYFETSPARHLLPQEVEFRLKPKHFSQERKPHAYSPEPAVLEELQSWHSLQNPLAALEAPHLAGSAPPTPDTQVNLLNCERPPLTVDLHIEKLLPDPTGLDAHQMKEHQLRVFQDCLEKAIVHAYDYIVFIHGIGDGKLKKAIHKRLDQNSHVRRHEPLIDGVFNAGATKVLLKAGKR